MTMAVSSKERPDGVRLMEFGQSERSRELADRLGEFIELDVICA